MIFLFFVIFNIQDCQDHTFFLIHFWVQKNNKIIYIFIALLLLILIIISIRKSTNQKMGNAQSSSSAEILMASHFTNSDFVKFIEDDSELFRILGKNIEAFRLTAVHGSELISYQEEDIQSLITDIIGEKGDDNWKGTAFRKIKFLINEFRDRFPKVQSTNCVDYNSLNYSIGKSSQLSNISYNVTKKKDSTYSKNVAILDHDDQSNKKNNDDYNISYESIIDSIVIDFFPSMSDNHNKFCEIKIMNKGIHDVLCWIPEVESPFTIISDFPLIKHQTTTNIRVASDYTDMYVKCYIYIFNIYQLILLFLLY